MHGARYRAIVAALAIIASPALARAALGDWSTFTRLMLRRVVATPTEIWAATEGGIIRSSLADSSVQTWTTTEGLTDNDVTAAAIDRRGTAWFGSNDGGLIRFTLSATGRPILRGALLEGELNGIAAFAQRGDTLFVGHQTGITVLDVATSRVIETYHQPGPAEVNHTQITALAVVGRRLIAGFANGVSSVDLATDPFVPGNWRYIRSDAFESSVDTIHAVAGFNGMVYIATAAGIHRETPNGWSRVLIGSARDLAVYDGAIWAAVATGLRASADGATWSAAAGLVEPLRSLAAVPGAMLVAAGNNGTWMVDRNGAQSARKVRGVDFPPYVKFRQLAVDTSGALWAVAGPKTSSSEDLASLGVARYKDGIWSHFPPGANGLYTPLPIEAHGFIDIGVDADNRVWASSYGQGAAVLDQTTNPPTFRRVDNGTTGGAFAGLDVNPGYIVARGFSRDPATGAMFVGTINTIAYAFPRGYDPGEPGVTNVTARFQPPNDTLISRSPAGLATVVDRNGLLWIGTELGLKIIDLNGTPTTASDDRYVGAISDVSVGGVRLAHRTVNDLAIDRDGTIWVATPGGVSSFRGTYTRSTNALTLQASQFTNEDGLPGNAVNTIISDSANVKWVGTTEGLAQITPGGTVVNLASTPLVDRNVRALAYDAKNGWLWVGTSNGLNRYEMAGGDGPPIVRPSENPFRRGLRVTGDTYVLDGADLTILVTPNATLRIYTVTGELVFDAIDSGSGQIVWNGLTRSGSKVVASGIYLYVAERDGAQTVGKIAVVRDAR